MITLGSTFSRWIVPLLAALLLVAITGLLPDAALDVATAAVGVFLLLAAALWYWRLDTRVQPEAWPRLRLAGMSVIVLLLALLYGLLIAALGLPTQLARFLYALLLGVAAASLTAALLAMVGLALLTRVRWARWLAALLGVGCALTVMAQTLRAHAAAPESLGHRWLALTTNGPNGDCERKDCGDPAHRLVAA